jgi:hypothetical protein
MCDYSLANLPNRLAVEGEQLVAHRFVTGSMGLTSPTERSRVTDPEPGQREGFGAVLRNFFDLPRPGGWRQVHFSVCAVCIPPGARLLLRDIPTDVQQRLGVAVTEEVTFVQMSAEAYHYRDAVRFKNGHEIKLQQLREGQRVDVLSVSLVDNSGRYQRLEEEYGRIFMAES